MSRRITAESMTERTGRHVIIDMINRHCDIIDKNILATSGAGFNAVSYELPTHFSLNNMTNHDAQLILYSELIETYESRGFTVVTDIRATSAMLHVSWLGGLTNEERQRRKQIIESHSGRK